MSNARRGRHFLPGMALLAGAVIIAGAALLAGATLLDGSAQNSPRVAMLEQAGWDAIKRDNLPLAAATFKEAITLDPKNAALRVGAGMAAFLQRHDAEAKSHLRAGAGSRSEADRGPRATGDGHQAPGGFSGSDSPVSRSWPPRILTTRASATRSIAGSANASYMSACVSRSATSSPCRSRALRMPSWPRRRSSR